MKACSYCGRDNADEVATCAECGTEFPEFPTATELPKARKPVVETRHEPASRKLIDLDQLAGAFDFQEGFSRPDWVVIGKAIESKAEEADRAAAWDEAAAQWLEQLRRDLGGSYWSRETEHFLLLSAVDGTVAGSILQFAERARSIIVENLRDVAWSPTWKEVLLLFDDQDDYYTYIAHGYEKSDIPRTAGVFVKTGYPHVALTFHNQAEACHTIAHELTHGSLHGLPVPLWLEEGVCETLRRMIGGPLSVPGEGPASEYWGAVSGWTPPVMWDELAERHHAFWDERNIQTFWAGTSFHGPQEAQELSYSLAEVLVHLLSGDHDGFLSFLGRAHYDDAGQTAALECLDKNLGDVVSEFLGPGDWRPYRKAIVDCWDADRPEGESKPSSDESA